MISIRVFQEKVNILRNNNNNDVLSIVVVIKCIDLLADIQHDFYGYNILCKSF